MRRVNDAPGKPTSLSSCQINQNPDTALMLDTVRFVGKWAVRRPFFPDRRVRLDIAPCVSVRADPWGNSLVWAECSLPRLLFGYNGRLIETQGQIDDALAKLHTKLATVADVPDVREWHCWRADMAWNLDKPASALILAHSCASVPGIHGAGTLWKGGQGVSWCGAKSRFVVTLYDKARKMRVPGSVLRAEVSLRGEHFRRHFQATEWSDFNALYAVYRRILAGIPTIDAPAKAADWQEAVGAESRETRMRILARLAHKSRTTYNNYQRRIEAAAAQLPSTFSWATILPPDSPPPAVHVHPRHASSLTPQTPNP